MKKILIAGIASTALVLAACGSTDTTEVAASTPEPTETATPTPTPEPEPAGIFTRETRAAVAECVAAVQDVGATLADYNVFGDAVPAQEQIDTAGLLCDDARIQIDLDGTDEIGQTPDNIAAVMISGEIVDLSELSLSLAVGAEVDEEVWEYRQPANQIRSEGVWSWGDDLNSLMAENAL